MWSGHTSTICSRSHFWQITPFLWSILLLTSLIWITESDWCPACFKPICCNCKRVAALSTGLWGEMCHGTETFLAPQGKGGLLLPACVFYSLSCIQSIQGWTCVTECRRKEASGELQLQVCVMCVLCVTVCGSQSTMPEGLLARGQGTALTSAHSAARPQPLPPSLFSSSKANFTLPPFCSTSNAPRPKMIQSYARKLLWKFW